MHRSLPLDRRQTLLALAACCLNAAPARAEEIPGLQVAGPPGTRLDRWAEPLARAVGRAMPTAAPLRRYHVGGLDGVTGANDFEARGEPDGNTALLVPGAAMLAWLAGETRAKFDPARWLPLWGAAMPCVLVSRVQLEAGRTLAVAAAGPTGPELPFLLALDLYGINPVLTSVQDADAVVLQGKAMPRAIMEASAKGFNPVLSLGVPGMDGAVLRDPLLPTIATTVELAQEHVNPWLSTALRAVTSATQLDASLVLPQLTPAAAVAIWRRASLALPNDPDLRMEGQRLGASMLPASDAAAHLNRIAGAPDTLLALRRWLATRYGWAPT